MEKQLIYEKMAAIMKAVNPIAKGQRNQQQGFMYRGIDDIMNELHEAFAANDVFLTTNVVERTEDERVSKNGGALFYVKCKCSFTFYTIDGSSVTATTIGEGMDSGDKGTNKAMSIALKYALLQTFLIPTNETKDPDGETHEVKPTPKSNQKVSPPPKKGVLTINNQQYGVIVGWLATTKNASIAKVKEKWDMSEEVENALKDDVMKYMENLKNQ